MNKNKDSKYINVWDTTETEFRKYFTFCVIPVGVWMPMSSEIPPEPLSKQTFTVF